MPSLLSYTINIMEKGKINAIASQEMFINISTYENNYTSFSGVKEYFAATATEAEGSTLPEEPTFNEDGTLSSDSKWKETVRATGYSESKKYLWNLEAVTTIN
jgi:hypothetical protein